MTDPTGLTHSLQAMLPTLSTLLTLHIATGHMMTGLIWLVQLVHYPSYHFVDRQRFSEFEQFHVSRISWIVLPLMLVELLSGALSILIMLSQAQFGDTSTGLGSPASPPSLEGLLTSMALVCASWITTFLLSVPCHQQLGSGYQGDLVERLVQTNWPRTVFWTLKSLLWLSLLT